MNPTQFLLLLHSLPRLGEKTLTRLTPEICLTLTATEWQERYDLPAEAAEALETGREGLLAHSSELARLLRTRSVSLLTSESAAYPARLERNDDAPPPLLYALGNLRLLEWTYTAQHFTFTLALSNGADPETLAQMERLAADLIEKGGIPITGHDRLPYQRLALAAQRQNHSIVYIFDRGLREALGPDLDRPPFAAARIRDANFPVDRDLALSPFRMDDHSLGVHNRRRDRLIFSLADLIIAVDVRAGGSMADECRRAFDQKRPVYVMDGGRTGNTLLRERGCPPLPTGKDWVPQALRRPA